MALMFFAVDSAFEPGRWNIPMRDRRIAIEIGIGRIVLRGEFDPRDVLDAHHRVGGLLDDDIAEFLGAGETAERLHRDLESARFVHRRLVEHAGGDLHVLPLQAR